MNEADRFNTTANHRQDRSRQDRSGQESSRQDAIELITQLLSGDLANDDIAAGDNMAGDAWGNAVARSRELVQELGALSSLLTGEPSMLNEKAEAYLTCEECEAALPGYVDAWQAGEALATAYPTVHDHLRGCADCQARALDLYQLLQRERAVAPVYHTFAEARQRSAAAIAAPIWQQTSAQVFRLAENISIQIEDAKAHFANVSVALTPHLVPATSLRGSKTEQMAEEMIEILELPHPDRDLVIRLRMGALQHDLGALALQFATLTNAQTLADIKVMLRDENGSLLESTRSDQDGLALFDELEPGKYQIQIERADQMWLVGVTIQG